MPNMSYCRFENTLSDLRDCYDHLYDDLEGTEEWARRKLVKLCREIAKEAEEESEDEE